MEYNCIDLSIQKSIKDIVKYFLSATVFHIAQAKSLPLTVVLDASKLVSNTLVLNHNLDVY